MSSFAITWIVFLCVFGGAVMGLSMRVFTPASSEWCFERIVKLAMGLVATMAALVLGLLVSSAKSSYDTQSNEVTDLSARLILLDRVLAHYGAETQETRDLLRGVVVDSRDRIWPQERGRTSQVVPPPPRRLFLTKSRPCRLRTTRNAR